MMIQRDKDGKIVRAFASPGYDAVGIGYYYKNGKPARRMDKDIWLVDGELTDGKDIVYLPPLPTHTDLTMYLNDVAEYFSKPRAKKDWLDEIRRKAE